jgi:hypothetical protein
MPRYMVLRDRPPAAAHAADFERLPLARVSVNRPPICGSKASTPGERGVNWNS